MEPERGPGSRWSFLAPALFEVAPRLRRPTCSIVIAAHNCAPFICGAVESALAQSSPPDEVIVCDDGSTDDLEVALRPFRSQIQLVSQPHRGEAAARNAAS